MGSERALLLIADIGGYTDYMRAHRMSLAHAEVNTARLLEAVIDAAGDFELIEIEGDAAFLSRQADAGDAGSRLARAPRPDGRRRRAWDALHVGPAAPASRRRWSLTRRGPRALQALGVGLEPAAHQLVARRRGGRIAGHRGQVGAAPQA